LAEDEPLVRQYLKTILEAGGYDVLEARDGEEAWRRFQADAAQVDAVVTDVLMPRAGGLELARRIRAAKPALPVLFLSGYVAEARIAEALTQPGMGFLSKPVARFDLLARLRGLISGRRATEAGT
jgi:CheY-like chemotaxis protein